LGFFIDDHFEINWSCAADDQDLRVQVKAFDGLRVSSRRQRGRFLDSIGKDIGPVEYLVHHKHDIYFWIYIMEKKKR